MLHLLYLVVFAALTFIAVFSLVKNLMAFAQENQSQGSGNSVRTLQDPQGRVPHPEFLDESGNVMNEPLLVMRSVKVEDIRDRLDAIYESSPGGQSDDQTDE